MKQLKIFLLITSVFILALSCNNEELNSDDSSTSGSSIDQTSLDVAQTSSQLASGTSFRISGSSTDSTSTTTDCKPGLNGARHNRHKGILDGLNLLAPTDELLAIVDAESAADIRGLRISKNGGATITNYNASGETVTIPFYLNDGPQGYSFSGHQFPLYDSLLASIVKTEIDFGTGVTYKRDTVEITRAGKIIITRSKDGSTITEVTTFDNYSVNDIKIEGTKTRISTYNSSTGSGSSTTSVTNGKITLKDGTVTEWKSDKSRVSAFTISESTGLPASGTITTDVNTSVTASDGTVIYAHKTTSSLIENIACEGRRKAPVSGTLETIYRTDTLLIDFGDGTCTNKTITITLNGVTSTKTIGD